MPKLRIKNFPDDLYARLEDQAKRTGNTVQDEVIETLRYALVVDKLKRKPQRKSSPRA